MPFSVCAGYMRKRRIALGRGSSKRIGRAIALSFARSKYYSGIVTSSRKVEQAEWVSEEINNLRDGENQLQLQEIFLRKMIVSS
jgi:NAD(P)-dependent dehydrogenase (short-subunit alcohol dehydrogenase family)